MSGSWGQGAGSAGALWDSQHSTKAALCFLSQTFPVLPGASKAAPAHKANCVQTSFLCYIRSHQVPKASTGESLKINHDSPGKDEFGQSKEWQFQHSPSQLMFCTEQKGFSGCRAAGQGLEPCHQAHACPTPRAGSWWGQSRNPHPKMSLVHTNPGSIPEHPAPASAAAPAVPALPEAIAGGL